MSIIIRSDQLMTNPPMNTGYSPGRALYRARFNDGNKDSLAGQVTASDAGLKQTVWVGGVNEFAVDNSNVVRGSVAGSISVGLPIMGQGAIMSWQFLDLPQGAPLYLDLFASTIGGAPDVYRLAVGSGSMALHQRIGNVSAQLSAAVPVAAGQRLGVRWVGGLLTALVNNTVVAEVATSAVTPNGYARLAAGNDSNSFRVDSAEVDVYI